jgi:hypothetical protein
MTPSLLSQRCLSQPPRACSTPLTHRHFPPTKAGEQSVPFPARACISCWGHFCWASISSITQLQYAILDLGQEAWSF